MSSSPEDILNTAGKIIESSNSESEVRASISRSYYSMYHKVLSILDNVPIQYEKKGVHASLITYLQTDAQHDEKHNFMSLKSLAYMLRQQKDSRVTADYDLSVLLELEHAEAGINTANRCFTKCDELIN